jgi:hypothetical protein
MHHYKISTHSATLDVSFAEKWAAAEVLNFIKDKRGVLSDEVYVDPAAVAAIWYVTESPE